MPARHGPGIPEQERAVPAEGSEGPLQPGNGLGLWAIHWGVRRMGGDLAFADREGDGTAVTLALPVAAFVREGTQEAAATPAPATVASASGSD